MPQRPCDVSLDRDNDTLRSVSVQPPCLKLPLPLGEGWDEGLATLSANAHARVVGRRFL